MKKIFVSGMKLSVNIIVAAVLSFFLCISMNVICTAVFTEYTGYKVYVYENDEVIDEYEYYYTDTDGDGNDDGTDTKKAEYEEQGYSVTEVKIRSELTGKGKATFLITTQIFSLIIIVSFASSSIYNQGFKDSNLVRTGHAKKDILKGLKTGLIGNIPFFVLFILLIAFAFGFTPNFRTVWYAIFNSHYYSLILWISGSAETASSLNALQFILLFAIQLIVPLISAAAYILGYKEINLSEKMIYKKESR